MHISTGVVFFETSTDVLQKEESKRWILYPMFLVRHQPNLRNILTRKKSPTLTPKADALLRCTNFCTSSYVFVFVLFLIDKRLEKKMFTFNRSFVCPETRRVTSVRSSSSIFTVHEMILIVLNELSSSTISTRCWNVKRGISSRKDTMSF